MRPLRGSIRFNKATKFSRGLQGFFHVLENSFGVCFVICLFRVLSGWKKSYDEGLLGSIRFQQVAIYVLQYSKRLYEGAIPLKKKVLRGLKLFYAVSKNFKWFQKGCPKVPQGSFWFHMFHKVLQGAVKWQNVPEGSRGSMRFREVLKGPRRTSQVLKGCPKVLQDSQSCSKVLEVSQRFSKVLQGSLCISKVHEFSRRISKVLKGSPRVSTVRKCSQRFTKVVQRAEVRWGSHRFAEFSKGLQGSPRSSKVLKGSQWFSVVQQRALTFGHVR